MAQAMSSPTEWCTKARFEHMRSNPRPERQKTSAIAVVLLTTQTARDFARSPPGTTVGGFSDKYISVIVRAKDLGSQLDPKVEILDAEGNVLVEASIDPADPNNPNGVDLPDPILRDFEPGADGNLFVRITADEAGADALAQQWLVAVYIFNEPVFGG